MKKFALPCLALGASLAVFGQQQPPAAQKIGVMTIQSALVSTKEGQQAAAALEAKFAQRKKELERKQGEIADLREKLQRGGNAMSDQAKTDLARNIDQKTKSYNRDMEDAQAEFEQEQNRVLNDLGQKMQAVIDKYARDNGFSLILDVNPQSPVLFVSNSLDITKEIVELYDKNSPVTSAPAPPPTTPTKPTTPPKKP